MSDPALCDLYGFTRSSWTYCWRCRMAIALEEPHAGCRGAHPRRDTTNRPHATEVVDR